MRTIRSSARGCIHRVLIRRGVREREPTFSNKLESLGNITKLERNINHLQTSSFQSYLVLSSLIEALKMAPTRRVAIIQWHIKVRFPDTRANAPSYL